MRVSKYLSYKEVTKSYTAIKRGINNIPSDIQLTRIIEWSRKIFDPIRSFIGAPLGCHTIFRCPELNRAVGGAQDSQHQAENGAAGDIDADIYNNSNNEIIFNYIKDNLDFDQLIAEGLHSGRIEWIHCSYVSPEKNRKEILLMYKEDNATHYRHYTPEGYKQIIDKFKK